ncbi:hypothetical protein H5410_047874 [Solanum commersonii]|uniref:Homeobox domain-containing protein n=1 Tax=Solanum commersonii TaxID=4109 RepID=A0A9J5XKB1_SOLCO|nr:hypothetical protein H5410_047874 [Solanum commersonii]
MCLQMYSQLIFYYINRPLIFIFLYLYSSIERFFKNCPLPNKNQQNQLAREAELEPKQVRIWFQNKRTQIKVILII